MGINLLSEKANWILEIVSHTSNEISEDIVTKKYQKFGYYDDKTMLKTLELLDRYARYLILRLSNLDVVSLRINELFELIYRWFHPKIYFLNNFKFI